MCRLFAAYADQPQSPADHLLSAPNALREQSRAHPDGWGIAHYDENGPQLVRDFSPAFADEAFADAALRIRSRTVVAHVRKASVGPLAVENTHPFRHGRWVLAHNGTVPGFDRLRPEVDAAISPAHRAWLGGVTDSERILALFLTHLEAAGGAEPSLGHALDALEATLGLVSSLCAGLSEAPSLNIVVTDGQLLAAHRSGRTLYCSAETADGTRVRHLLLASERIGPHEAWMELPEGAFIGIDAGMRLVRRDAERAPDAPQRRFA